jgi:hypothetical protein
VSTAVQTVTGEGEGRLLEQAGVDAKLVLTPIRCASYNPSPGAEALTTPTRTSLFV